VLPGGRREPLDRSLRDRLLLRTMRARRRASVAHQNLTEKFASHTARRAGEEARSSDGGTEEGRAQTGSEVRMQKFEPKVKMAGLDGKCLSLPARQEKLLSLRSKDSRGRLSPHEHFSISQCSSPILSSTPALRPAWPSGFTLGENVAGFCRRANYERGPNHAHDFLAVHVLFLHHAKGITDFFIGIASRGEGQFELLLKLFLRLGRVGGRCQVTRRRFFASVW